MVGPVCESSDFQGLDRRLPPLKAGDLLAILGTGAYVSSMASTYNSRPRAAEVMVDRIYLELLCRHPSVSETATIEAYRVKSKLPPAELCRDTIWAVINSSGFLFRY